MTDYPDERITALARAFAALYELVQYLRSDRGCPWDRKQTLGSMHECLGEETGELGDAITATDNEGISEEWGDVLFILLMIAVIGEETDCFNAEKAMRSIEAKMIRRHPHVFGSSDVGAVEEVLSQWERIKAGEKNKQRDSLMDDMPSFYSALKRADHVQKTAAGIGFDWPDSAGVIEKIEEEVAELRQALAEGDNGQTADEVGDLLFSCINLARFQNLDAETMLNRTIDKFIKRFRYVESELRRAGKSPEEATLSEMDALWEQAKTRVDVSKTGNRE